ncbi:MAG: diacylglycerol kinase family lipid kinase [Labilithrix sp.]|nr:diacylglycerol kinase family lipid kinase [Labilithrix sp.]MCW5811785.1 diacylglycerol kinase family lipid kinase [Labilithrix sp.]
MKPLLVVNPRSGGGTTARTFAAMRGTIERALGACEVAMTEHPGHGIDLARQGAIAGHPLVVAVGGDGTIHEVVNGLMQARSSDYGTKAAETALGVIGQGTGGDFRKTLGTEHRLDRYVEAIASGKQRAIDVGKFSGGGKTSHWFVNILSAGMGGLVDRYVASAPRALGGKAAYFGASLKALFNAELGHVRVTITNDGKSEEHLVRSFMIAICNGRYFGGGMKVAPMAEIDDGVLELVALGATSKIGFALTSGSIYSGDHVNQAGTVHLRGQKMKLELVNTSASDVYLLDVDGEPMGGLPLEVEVVPKALTLRA